MPDFFSRINISEDLSLFLTILAVDFFLDQCQIIFPGKICLRILALLLSQFFLDQCQIFFSRINISEDFSLFLTILAVDFFLDQCQIFFPGKICLRILALLLSQFFLDQCQIIFSDQYF